jgi:hypothetical protein
MKIHPFQGLQAMNEEFGQFMALSAWNRSPLIRRRGFAGRRLTYRARKWRRIDSSSMSLTPCLRTMRLRHSNFWPTTGSGLRTSMLSISRSDSASKHPKRRDFLRAL